MSCLAEGKEPLQLVGQLLSEPGQFAYGGLCGVTLSLLFPGEEHRLYRVRFIDGLVEWLQLSESVLPVMEAFANGLGGEGAITFADLLLKEPALKDNQILITQDLVSFSLKDGRYDARARALIRHITWLLRIPFEELEMFEESLVETLKENKEKDTEEFEISQKKKDRKKKLKRYFLIGLATVGGGTVIGML